MLEEKHWYVHCLISRTDLRCLWNVMKIHIHKETAQEFAAFWKHTLLKFNSDTEHDYMSMRINYNSVDNKTACLRTKGSLFARKKLVLWQPSKMIKEYWAECWLHEVNFCKDKESYFLVTYNKKRILSKIERTKARTDNILDKYLKNMHGNINPDFWGSYLIKTIICITTTTCERFETLE